MTFLDIFALFVLIVLAAAVVGIWVMLGMMPGKIARERHHPQAKSQCVQPVRQPQMPPLRMQLIADKREQQ